MSDPIRLAVLGATGRVGRLVVAEAVRTPDLLLVAALASSQQGQDAGRIAGIGPTQVAIAPLGEGCFADADVVVDFSAPEALIGALPHLGSAALVTGTTGLAPAQLDRLVDHSDAAPLLMAPNFSTGITLLLDLVDRASRALPDYDLEIVETHHRDKVDAPSGTALALGRAAAGARNQDLDAHAIHGRRGHTGVRPDDDIGIHALRMGDVVGEHTVWLAGPGDRIRLGHVATDRATFAHGALRAARWLHGRGPGRYGMRDVLGLT